MGKETVTFDLSPFATIADNLTMDSPPNRSRSETIWTVVAQLRSERRRLMLMRASTLALVATWLLTLVWAIPLLPFGVRSGDYAPSTAVAILLVNLSYGGLLVWLGRWGSLFSRESAPEFVRVLFGAKLLIRGRSQFISRLNAECSSRSGRRPSFSLIVVRLAHSEGTQLLGADTAILRTRAMIRSDDIFGEVGPSELGVLSRGTAGEAAKGMVARIQGQLAASATFSLSSIGASTYPVDGEDGERLLATARQRLSPIGHVSWQGHESEPVWHSDNDLPEFLVRQLAGRRHGASEYRRQEPAPEQVTAYRSLMAAVGSEDAGTIQHAA
ncbi:MAG: hypothetical protein WBD55_09880 [Dehalococcoidia bacterium]